MDLVHRPGTIAPPTKVSGKMTAWKAKELIDGLTEESTPALGLKIKCMVKDTTLGLTEENIKVIMILIRNKVGVHMFGQTVKNLKEIGLMDNKTEKELSRILKGRQGKVSGKMVNVKIG
tara:strand:- start:242 stop:598 length:357 start_codon:yes stop_codon:yes gene_type:complete